MADCVTLLERSHQELEELKSSGNDQLDQAIDKNEGLLELIRRRDSELKESNNRIDELEEDRKEARRRIIELE